MTVFGFHVSHEQVHPSALLEAVQPAEQVGFSAAMCSDHFSPWSERQGHSGFAWSWLGTAYHPAIVGQAVSRLTSMFPGRFWAALGTGDHVTHFDAAAEHVPPEALRGPVLVSSDLGQHAAWLQELVDLGFDEVYLHHVGQEQRAWLEVFGEQVLPQLDVTAKLAA